MFEYGSIHSAGTCTCAGLLQLFDIFGKFPQTKKSGLV